MRILLFTAEQWPTHRADLITVYGKYLPRFGINSDLVTEKDVVVSANKISPWIGGSAFLCDVPRNRAAQYIVKFLHQCKVLLTTDYQKYDALQVRDMVYITLFVIVMSKIHSKPLFYWLSYPQSEGQVERAKARGFKGGMRYWFPLIQGTVGQWLLYKLILPNCQHIFVQSQNMLERLVEKGIDKNKMMPVPMGVDLEAIQEIPEPSDNPILAGKRVIVYLGTLDRTRQIESLFYMVQIIKKQIPNILLVLAGDTEDTEHRQWLKDQASQLGVTDEILWTGWLPMRDAWRYIVSAEVGLSPFPRGYLLDMASPTKAVEYMAFGLPVVANDSPDQAQVITESKAGDCVELKPEIFAESVIKLLNNPEKRAEMGVLGKAYIQLHRSYNAISLSVANKYQTLIVKKV